MQRRAFLAASMLALASGPLVAPPLLRLRERVRRARAEAVHTRPYEQLGNGDAVLVVGDSTARGAGAERAQLSVAGRIGAALPQARVVNLGASGAGFAEVVDQLRGEPQLPYRFVLMMAGADDVLRLTPPARVEHDLQRALRIAYRLSNRVIVMALPNLGHAPLVPWPLKSLFAAYSQRLHRRISAATTRTGTPLVDLYVEGSDDPVARDPGRYVARDGLHPSAASYALWFEQLQQVQPALLREPAAPLRSNRRIAFEPTG